MMYCVDHEAVSITAVADPGFPRGGGANPPGRGRVPTYNFYMMYCVDHEAVSITHRKSSLKLSNYTRWKCFLEIDCLCIDMMTVIVIVNGRSPRQPAS